jgi:hypothetical protein
LHDGFLLRILPTLDKAGRGFDGGIGDIDADAAGPGFAQSLRQACAQTGGKGLTRLAGIPPQSTDHLFHNPRP